VRACGKHGSMSLFAADVVNEIVERLERTRASVTFADPIDTLAAA